MSCPCQRRTPVFPVGGMNTAWHRVPDGRSSDRIQTCTVDWNLSAAVYIARWGVRVVVNLNSFIKFINTEQESAELALEGRSRSSTMVYLIERMRLPISFFFVLFIEFVQRESKSTSPSFCRNLITCWPISKILSLSRNLQQSDY